MSYPTPTKQASATPLTPPLKDLVQNAGERNTFMIRNVPTSLSRDELVAILDKEFKGGYDFIYLPMDAKSEDTTQNRGFAFVNFRNLKRAAEFTKAFNQEVCTNVMPTKDGLASEKVCEIVAARLSSVDKTLDKLRSDPQFTTEWAPLLFGKNGEPKRFPFRADPVQSEVVDVRDTQGKKKKNNAPPRERGPAMSHGYPGYPMMDPMAMAAAAQASYGYPGFPGYPAYPPMMDPTTMSVQAAAQAAAMAEAHAASQAAYAHALAFNQNSFNVPEHDPALWWDAFNEPDE
jgi:hypothetical protein